MAITFDHINKNIIVPAEEARPISVETLRTACRNEEASERGIVFTGMVKASGLNQLGTGVKTALTLELINNWQIKFVGSGAVTITGGNLIGGINEDPFADSPGITIQNLLSANATTIETTAENIAIKNRLATIIGLIS